MPQVTNDGRATVRSTISRWRVLLDVLKHIRCDSGFAMTSRDAAIISDFILCIEEALEHAR